MKKRTPEIKDKSKRKFLKNCGLALVAGASYEVIAILGPPGQSQAKTCEGRCEDFCVENCTGCTTAPCFEVPEPTPSPGGTEN